MLEIMLLLLGGLIAIYIACSKFLSNLNKLIYGKGTILAWLPFTSIYLMGKLAFNNLVGWGLLVICILSSSYTVTVNGVETVQTIAPVSIQGPLSKIYPLLNFGVFVYCIIKYNKLKKSGVPPMPKTFVEKNLQPVQSQPMEQVVQPQPVQPQPVEQQVQESVQPQSVEQPVQQNVQSQPVEKQVQTEVPVQHTEVQPDITNQQPVQEEPKKFFNTEPVDQQDNQVSLDQVLNMSFDEVAQPVEEHTEQQAAEQVVNEPAVEESDLNKVLNMSFNEETQPVKEVKPQPIEQPVQQNVQSVQPKVMEQPVSTQQENIQNDNQ